MSRTSLDAIDEESLKRKVYIMDMPETHPNPVPFGFIGYGLNAIIVGFANLTVYNNDIIVWMMAAFSGGLIQLITGIFEFKRNQMFTATAYAAYSCYWFAQVAIWLENSIHAPIDKYGYGTFQLFWGIFTLAMFFGTLKSPITVKLVYITLFLVYLFLAISIYIDNKKVQQVAGACGVASGLIAFYNAMTTIICHENGIANPPI
ncbi:hypothetical protein M9Y10_028288 [Tritrichomonas musculus]|uniref:GPR1/FUN34/yaaH family protein n=1 Tax=Tritrichomonas musculus TaxID=1915356 RepID=A0ABR2KIV5_9EUKA